MFGEWGSDRSNRSNFDNATKILLLRTLALTVRYLMPPSMMITNFAPPPGRSKDDPQELVRHPHGLGLRVQIKRAVCISSPPPLNTGCTLSFQHSSIIYFPLLLSSQVQLRVLTRPRKAAASERCYSKVSHIGLRYISFVETRKPPNIPGAERHHPVWNSTTRRSSPRVLRALLRAHSLSSSFTSESVPMLP
jgi:hypothetical protein